MSWGSVVPALPHYISEFEVGAIGLGGIIAAFGLGRLISNIPAGILSRYMRPWPFLVSMVFAVFVCTIVTGLLTDFVTVLALRFVAGIFAGAAITIGQSLVLGSAPVNARGRVSSILQAAQLSGAALGPALGGAAMSLFGVFPAFIAASSGCFVFVLWTLIRWRSVHVGTVGAISRGRRALADSLAEESQSDARRARFLFVLAMAALNGVGFVIFAVRFGGQQSLVPLLSVEVASVEAWQLGLGLGAITVLSLAVLPLVGAASDRWDRRWIIAPSLAVSAALTPLYLLVDGPLAFLAVMLGVGIFGSLAGGLPLASLADAVPARQFGVTTGIYRTFGDLGTIVGPLVLTAVYAQVGTVSAVWALTALSFTGAVLACVPLVPSSEKLSSIHDLNERDLVGTEVASADLQRPAILK